jgi:hypothetical protein
VNLYAFLKRIMGMPDEAPAQPALAQITIISTDPAKSSSGSPSPRARR